MSIDDLKDQINSLVREFLDSLTEADYQTVKATGIDTRAFGSCYYDEDTLVISASDNQRARYYGGFEYIDSCYVEHIGEYVAYSGENDRIRRILDKLNKVEESDEDEGDEE